MCRQAATLILSIPKTLPKSLFNYEILTMKRAAKASFMPNNNVFPGGTLSTADSDKKWLTRFRKCQIENLALKSENAPRPPITFDDNSKSHTQLTLF